MSHDNTRNFALWFGPKFINDKGIKDLKIKPKGIVLAWVYSEVLVNSAKTGGIIIADETFPTIADQIAAQMYGITPDEVAEMIKYFTGIGYIKVEGKQYIFLQVPAFIKYKTGIVARKEKQQQDNIFPGTSLSSNPSGKQCPPQTQQQIQQHLYTEKKNKNNNKQQLGNTMKRILLFESWGIEAGAAKELALLPHVQAYSDDFLKDVLAYASKRSRDNLAGYLRTILEKPKLVLHNRAPKRWKKIYNPNCPKCHGTGTYTIKIDNGNDYKDAIVMHCDCWEKYRTGDAAK